MSNDALLMIKSCNNKTFEEDISPDHLIPILSRIAGQTIVREKTLIVFDEVQLCERALTSLKYFCENAPDYPIKLSTKNFGMEDGKKTVPLYAAFCI